MHGTASTGMTFKWGTGFNGGIMENLRGVFVRPF
jgi:hypothetical protein